MQILALVFAQGPRDVKSRASRAEKREDDLPNLYTKFDDLRNFYELTMRVLCLALARDCSMLSGKAEIACFIPWTLAFNDLVVLHRLVTRWKPEQGILQHQRFVAPNVFPNHSVISCVSIVIAKHFGALPGSLGVLGHLLYDSSIYLPGKIPKIYSVSTVHPIIRANAIHKLAVERSCFNTPRILSRSSQTIWRAEGRFQIVVRLRTASKGWRYFRV